MGFSRQEYWSGLPFSSLGDFPDPGIEPRSPALQADALTSEPPGKPKIIQDVFFLGSCISSISVIVLRFIHVSGINVLLLFNAKQRSIVELCFNLFIHIAVSGHFCYFQFCTITCKARIGKFITASVEHSLTVSHSSII